MKKTVVIAVVLAALACATVAWSQGPPGPGGMGRPMMSSPAMAVMPPHAGMVNRMTEALQLTEDQTSKLETITAKNDENVRTLSQKSEDASKALHDALLAANFDAQKVKDLAATAEKAEAALIGASIDEWTQIRAILTTDQAKGLQDVMSVRGPGPGQRPFGPPPGGPGTVPMGVPQGGAPPPPPPPGQ